MKQNQNPFEDLFGTNIFGGANPLKGKKKDVGNGQDQGPEKFDSNGNPVRRFRPFRGIGIGFFVLLLVYMGMNSYYMLDEENYAVVTTLGSAQAVSQAGLHFKIPFIQRVRKVSKGIKGMPIGYVVETGGSIDEESIMITKDFNFLKTDFLLG